MAQRAIFISGANSGIGLASVRRLTEFGFKVYAGVLPGEDSSTLETIDAVEIIALDITKPEMIADAARVVERGVGEGGLFGLFNNAGVPMTGPMEYLPIPALRQQMDVNLFGHVELTQYMLPLLRLAPSARIVNTASILGRVVVPFGGAYSISKHAMEAYSDALRQELAPFGIKVSILEPGAIATPIWTKTVANAQEMIDELPPQAQRYYRAGYVRMAQTSVREGEGGIAPDVVGRAVLHAFTATRPKIRYVIGKDAQTIALLRRLLPDSVVDWILSKRYPTMG